MNIVFYIAMAAVIGGHFFFAYLQWFNWPELSTKLTDLAGPEVEKTAFLGRSIASYNASIGLGLLASIKLDEVARAWVQGMTLALIVATAAVGAAGTQGNTILITRLLPAAVALAALIYVNRRARSIAQAG